MLEFMNETPNKRGMRLQHRPLEAGGCCNGGLRQRATHCGNNNNSKNN